MKNKEQIKVVDLFCGIGGWSSGLKRAGLNVIYAVDNWNLTVKSYKANYPNVNVVELDILKMNYDNKYLKEADIIIGSPPCKSFSALNSKRDFDLKLTKKFIELTKNRNFVMENVAELKKQIEINKIQIEGDGEILKMSNFNVPQIRKRYIHSNFIDIKDLSGNFNVHANIMEYISKFKDIHLENDIPRHSKEIERKISEVENGKQHRDSKFGVYYRIPLEGYSQAVVNVTKSMMIHPFKNRRLTVNEAKILQTFPPNYIVEGTVSQKGEMIANAVPPNFAYIIGLKIVDKCLNLK